MAGATLDRQARRLLAVAWVLVLSGAVVLVLGYRSMPVTVVVYRFPWADAPTMGARSLLTTGRLVLMGVGQLGSPCSRSGPCSPLLRGCWSRSRTCPLGAVHALSCATAQSPRRAVRWHPSAASDPW